MVDYKYMYIMNRFLQSSFYCFLVHERQEIDKLKWIESEKENRDIGYNKAVFLWKTNYRKGWVTQYKELSTF